jgi:Domain of unknown function (DUF4112)
MPDREIERARTVAKVLDHYLVDPIVGLLLPGVGDIATSVAGLYTVGVAISRKLSAVIIARMLLNLALDALLGAVPLIGDLFDLAHRANTKNVALLEQRSSVGGRATPLDWAMVMGAFALFAAAVAGSIYIGYRVVTAVAHAL